MKKRVVAILLAVCMLAVITPVSAKADENTKSGTYENIY
jgi:hypothetical protein